MYTAAETVYKNYESIGLKHPIPFLGTGLLYIRFAKEEPELYRLLFLTPKTGFGGSTGASTGTHLHFTVIKDGGTSSSSAASTLEPMFFFMDETFTYDTY